jgi:hypothetical protein
MLFDFNARCGCLALALIGYASVEPDYINDDCGDHQRSTQHCYDGRSAASEFQLVTESAHPKLFAGPWERRHPACFPFPIHQAPLDAETRNADEQRIKKRWTPISLPRLSPRLVVTSLSSVFISVPFRKM